MSAARLGGVALAANREGAAVDRGVVDVDANKRGAAIGNGQTGGTRTAADHDFTAGAGDDVGGGGAAVDPDPAGGTAQGAGVEGEKQIVGSRGNADASAGTAANVDIAVRFERQNGSVAGGFADGLAERDENVTSAASAGGGTDGDVAAAVEHGFDAVDVGDGSGTGGVENAAAGGDGGDGIVTGSGQNALDRDVAGVEQQIAAAETISPRRQADVLGAEVKIIFARHLGEAAVAALGAAACIKAADEVGGVVGPDHDLAAVGAQLGVGLEDDVAVYHRGECVLNAGVFALIVAAHQDGAAAVSAGCVDLGVAGEGNVAA